jgi:UDP-GlcNAc3NAcA epimerase
MKRLLTIVGARPQFIKAAAVHRAIAARDDVTETIVHTGQHFDDDMSGAFFRELEIPEPAHTLDVNRCGHGTMTGRMMIALEPIVERERPDAVLVYGDTNSTLAGALVAAKLHVPVLHVEAGLRSFNRRMPEELNRVLTDHVSALLCCPTRAAVDNLRAEGITAGVHHTGDVMYDAALFARGRGRGLDGPYALATVHRAENTDDPAQLRAVVEYLRAVSPQIVLPLHPRTRAKAEEHGVSLDGLRLIPPAGYLDMAALIAGATCVYTDSGGVQKEAYFHRVPCVTLRDESEWVETIAAGWNRLWRGPAYAPRAEITDYGTGTASQTIVELIARLP